MSAKLCLDEQCRSLGELLPLSEFPSNKRKPDKVNIYCRECSVRRVQEYRVRKAEHRLLRTRHDKLERKPMILTPVAAVRDAIAKGCKTREELKIATRLPWDELGEVLADLTFANRELRVVRLGSKREFHLAA